MKYYHGTTDKFGDLKEIKPSIETGILREDFRKNNRNLVYVTISEWSAYKYAVKACKKYGGKPIIYEVKPDEDTLNRRIDCEYITRYAKVLRRVE